MEDFVRAGQAPYTAPVLVSRFAVRGHLALDEPHEYTKKAYLQTFDALTLKEAVSHHEGIVAYGKFYLSYAIP
ncbi:hypothetical protein PT974_01144 [Cladobotryum mycophilum]|uniref:Uncharacterized protein n=1 Tax=Cladobotryum mycophilum TaxID=491253 RepID=A0ABR0T3R9_9HYPO